ncbi:MAG TPA: ABC transporter permease [Bryobacteraceae bacterium]|nr:ABC transporter permease [Bryobacteraceae bacterium]
MLHDLRLAARALWKNPGFTLTALITLALAIGANSAIFTLANALIFASLPVAHPDRLVEISTINAKAGKDHLSIPAFQAFQEKGGVFTSLLAWNGGGMENLEMNGTFFAGSVDEIAGDYYGTLGIRPALGRLITREDIGLERFTPARVAVIGYRAWQERFHGDTAALGKTIRIDGKPYTVVGVHPQSFPGLIREAAADATVPLTAAASRAEKLYDRKHDYNTVIGRLRDGVTEAQARARVTAVWPSIRQATAPDGPERNQFLTRRIQVEPAARGISYLRATFARPLYILFGIVALLLLLACVNLANVALARSHARAAEWSVRAALGAPRWRLLRASFAESLLVAVGGAIPGLMLAYWGAGYIAHFMWRGYVPLVLSLTPDLRVVLFTAAAAISASVLFGLAPAWRAAHQDTGGAIRQGGTRVTGGLGVAGNAMVTVQIALSFAILAGALLFSSSLGNILRRDPGFSAGRLLVAQLFPRSTYQGFDNPAYFRQLLEALRAMPGVTAATIAHDRPVGQFVQKVKIMPAGTSASYHLVSPGFFDTLGMRILRGRDFDLRDDEGRPLVAIASAALARWLAPSGDAIGQRVKIGDGKGEYEIVGIASDATLDDPREANAPAIYAASFQRADWLGWSDAIVRTPGDPARLMHALRERIESLGREYPLRFETVDEELDHALLPERVLTLLTGFFGALGLLLAAVGLYGLLSYTVARRTGEIGVRVALGASRGDIAKLVMRNVAALLAIGLAVGMAIEWAGARAITAFLYGLSSHDPAVLGAAAGVLALVAVLASVLPSVRAVRVDPMVALRHE